MTYKEAIAQIAALEPRGWRLGLDRMAELCRRAGLEDAIGDPIGPQFIHVAGTNGKGSTTAFVQSLLVSADYRTGAFFSPYVVDYRERFQLNRDLIAPDRLVEVTERLWSIAESLSETEFGGVTKFEFEAAIGFEFWKEERCDWVALEVGLGGRLDATNVVTPRCSVIVSIGLDHVAILGDTLAAIAGEKAGILKPGVPCVMGDLPPEAVAIVENRALELGCPLLRFGKEIFATSGLGGISVTTPRASYEGLRSGIGGIMQPHNLALAIAALEAGGVDLSAEVVAEGAEAAWAPGRLEERVWHGCRVLLDGAHNRQAAEVLRKGLEQSYPGTRFHLVTNMLHGHDPAEFYEQIADLVISAHAIPVEFHRALPPAEVAAVLSRFFPDVKSYPSVDAGLTGACSRAAAGEMVLVTGSNYAVGAVAGLIASASS